MTTYPIPSNERERLEELFSYKILDTPIENEFEDIVNIVVKTFNVPAAAITFIDNHRQWIKAEHGLGFCEIDRGVSICNHVILQSDILEVSNLEADERFCRFPYVTGAPHYRFYAGAPLITRKGYHIGSLCIVDDKVRNLNTEEHKLLIAFARNIVNQLDLRLQNIALQQQNDTQKCISAALSHDVRGPLANVKMMLELQEEELSEAGEIDDKEMNKMLRQGVDNTMCILNNMIEWGKLQLSGDNTATSFKLRDLADASLNEVYDTNSVKFNTLVNAVPDNVTIRGEYNGIRFVLRNLLTNAGKFTYHGCITVSCEQSCGKTLLTVCDTGTGISPETTARLNRGQKIMHTSGTHNENGNGLGLSLVQEYLAKQSKELYFQSLMGKGTVVSFEI